MQTAVTESAAMLDHQSPTYRSPSPLVNNSVNAIAFQRLERTLRRAPQLTIDKQSKLVFFSDLHRGDGGILDRFAPNRSLFLQTLRHYDKRGFSYVEVGDGDELWYVDSADAIAKAHAPVFAQLKRMHDDSRLHILVGNHDVGRNPRDAQHKGSIPLINGLSLRYMPSQQHIFVTHGHQVDMQSGYLTRMMCRHMAQPFQRMALESAETEYKVRIWLRDVTHRIEAQVTERATKLEQRILAWGQQHQNKLVICGHTHRARFGLHNYFNTGSCLEPGVLTGLEIFNGELRQIRWVFSAEGHPQRQIASTLRLGEPNQVYEPQNRAVFRSV